VIDSKNRTDIIYLSRSVHRKGTKKDQSRGGRNQALSKKHDKEMKHVLQQHAETEAKVYDIWAVEPCAVGLDLFESLLLS
jgi:transposase